ncbi:hypothetical protein [Sphingomonas sp.]|uniref:DUF6414 family protein n=1 Tax=Sphingomonas sp. TaxID=28214 RepID=UPI0031E19C30
MSLPWWLGGKRRPTTTPEVVATATRDRPLREFIYLDEVSLRSLLSSQKGEVTDSTSEQNVAGNQGEVATSLGAGGSLLAKADISSRYQTSNSSTLQTSRKATVQSWFREFHALDDLRIVEPRDEVEPFSDVAQIEKITDRSLAIPTAELKRGQLVEFRVRLTADPVFRFGTLMTEFTSMADENPGMFAANNVLGLVTQTAPVNRILQRLLAGLIPIRAKALDHVVVRIGATEYVVHHDSIADLGLEARPLDIVGVTEHLAYWKDIRRVLFSEAEFTLLARVARDGLHDTWTPVKLAALFVPHAPDLVEQINTAGRSSLQEAGVTSIDTNVLLLGAALEHYRDAVVRETGASLEDTQTDELDRSILALRDRTGSTTAQRSAFKALGDLITRMTGSSIDGRRDHELREEARIVTGLPMFPSLSQGTTTMFETSPPATSEAPRLLDVEVVAIYW